MEFDIEKINSKMETILSALEEIKENAVTKVYNTKELCDYLKVGRSVVEKLRQDGELSYAKVGRTIIFTQSDVEDFIRRNHVKFVC